VEAATGRRNNPIMIERSVISSYFQLAFIRCKSKTNRLNRIKIDNHIQIKPDSYQYAAMAIAKNLTTEKKT
jgi:hypothetical protein